MPAPSADERAALRDLMRPTPDLSVLSSLPDGATVLEAFCGGGRTLSTLSARLRVQGVEPDPAARALARERLGPDVPLHAELPPSEPVDAVLCLGGALCAVPDEAALAARCRALAAAVRPGGVVIVEPDLAEVYQGQALMQTHSADGIKIVRSAVTRLRGARCQRDWSWLVARDTLGVQTFEERSVRLVLERDALIQALAAAGLEGDTAGTMWSVRRVEVV